MAGLLLLAGGIVSLIGIHAAEFVYPGYSVSQNFVSDLGATCSDVGTNAPHDCVVVQPASAIFSLSAGARGVAVFAAAYLMYPMGRPKRLAVLLGLTGLGALGVGLVSEAYSPYHAIFALVAFLLGGIAALESFRFLPRPLGYVSVVLGCIALVALGWFSLIALGTRGAAGGEAALPIWAPLGAGGTERMILYPVLLWVVVFGAALVALPHLFAKPAPVAAAAGTPPSQVSATPPR